MRQHRARAVGQIAFAVVVWSSCLPAASACSLTTFTTSCNSSQQAMIGIIAASVVFLIICAACLRRRLARRRVVRLSRVPFDGMGVGGSSNPPKPFSVPVPGASGYPMYYQATTPAPPPVNIPQYPPRGYGTHRCHSRPQSTAWTMPEPIAPVLPASMRAPSNTIPRPISTLDTTSHSLRSTVRREEPTRITSPHPSSLSPGLPRNTQMNVAESPPLPSSPPPQRPTVVIAPASAPSPRPSGATVPPNAARPSALSPMATGTSNNVEEPPPAYTPI